MHKIGEKEQRTDHDRGVTPLNTQKVDRSGSSVYRTFGFNQDGGLKSFSERETPKWSPDLSQVLDRNM